MNKKSVLILSVLVFSLGVVSALECGDTITENTILTEDITDCGNFEGFGLKIDADNVVLDCDGHTVSGSGFGLSDVGILSYSKNNIQVKNCKVSNFDYGIGSLYSSLGEPGNTTILHNEVTHNGYGIFLWGTHGDYVFDNLIKNNRIRGIGINGRDGTYLSNRLISNHNGIFMTSHNSLIKDNEFVGNYGYGIALIGYSHDNSIWNNTFMFNENNVYEGVCDQTNCNSWDSQGIGNFWHDWVLNSGYSSGIYIVGGPGDGVDHFPRTNCQLFAGKIACSQEI